MSKELMKQLREMPGNKIVGKEGDLIVAVFEAQKKDFEKIAIKCETNEEHRFIVGKKGIKPVNFIDEVCVSSSACGTQASEEWFLHYNYQIITFSEYLKQEDLRQEYCSFLVAEATIRGFDSDIRLISLHAESNKCTLADNVFTLDYSLNLWGSGKDKNPQIYSNEGKWAEIIPPIFETDDEEPVKKYDGDKYWKVLESWRVLKFTTNGNASLHPDKRGRFDTKEAAEEYVRKNKPIDLVDGEIYFFNTRLDFEWVARFEKYKEGEYYHYSSVDLEEDGIGFDKRGVLVESEAFNSAKPATTEQIKQLLKAEADHDMFWDSATKKYL